MKKLKGIRYISFGKTSLSETLKKIERELVKNKNNNKKVD